MTYMIRESVVWSYYYYYYYIYVVMGIRTEGIYMMIKGRKQGEMRNGCCVNE